MIAARRQTIDPPGAVERCNTLPSEPTPLLACLARMGDDTLARCGLPAISWTLCELLPDGDRKPIAEALRLIQQRLLCPARSLDELVADVEPGPVAATSSVIAPTKPPVVITNKVRAPERPKAWWVALAVTEVRKLRVGERAKLWALFPVAACNHKAEMRKAILADGRFEITPPDMRNNRSEMIRRVW